jgi:DNA-binding MarR family transcriptional regulator
MVSRVVDEVAREGWVAREPDPDDKRSAYAVLTDAGRGRLRRAAPTNLAGIRRHFGAVLTEDDARAVTDALGKVLYGLPTDGDASVVIAPPMSPVRGLRPRDRRDSGER